MDGQLRSDAVADVSSLAPVQLINLGKSDIKTVAVKDGEVLYSQGRVGDGVGSVLD